MNYKKKTWKEKLENNKNFPKILYFNSKLPCGKALLKLGAKTNDSVVLAPPKDVYEIMKNVPEGKLITLNQICEKLSKKYGTKFCCTLTTGIFVTIVANASVETGDDVPYWRTIKNNGELNEKFLGGLEQHKILLEKENHKIIEKGKKYFVLDFENKLM
jgi:alkylated DNA nucleotide flippase Atl1